MTDVVCKPDLVRASKDFFDKHWGVHGDVPQWDFSWRWNGAVPNYLLGGLYALLSGDRLIYIGLGASRGGGLYQERGISRRLIAHVISSAADRNAGRDYVLQSRWDDLGVDVVATIGFPLEYAYLAPALEDYLIGRLNPPENLMKRRVASEPN